MDRKDGGPKVQPDDEHYWIMLGMWRFAQAMRRRSMIDGDGQQVFEGDVLKLRAAPWSKVKIVRIHGNQRRATLEWVTNTGPPGLGPFMLDTATLRSSNWIQDD